MKFQKKTLEEVADFCLGKMLDKKKNKGDLRPYLANVNVRWGEFDFDNLREMRFEQHELVKFGLEYGDIVMCEGGEPGRCAIWKNQIPAMMIQKALHRIRPHKCLDNHFLYYTFLDYGQTGQFSPLFTGATIKHLPREKLALLEIELPPLPTQRKIASILSAYDDLIENNSRRIAILEEMAQAIYREWFVNFRFPGHENVKLVESNLGMIPEGWKATTVGDLAVNARRSVNPQEVDSETPYVGLEHIPRKSITLTDWGIASEIESTKHRFCEGEILFGKIRPYFHKVAVAPFDGICSSDAIVIVPRNDNYFPSVLCCVSSVPFVDHATQTSQGTKMPRANWDVLTKYPLPLPPADLLGRFNEVVRDIVSTLKTLMLKNDNLRTTRDLLLPKLISGQLDVEDIDIDLGMTAEEISEATAKSVERKPTVRATAEIDSASTESTITTSEPIPIDELDVDQVMAEFRQQARRLGTTTRAELLKAVSQELGYKRLGHNIEEVLKGHLRAAIRRKIIAAEGELVCLHTPSMETYERDELVDAFHSVMRKNISYEREDVIRALANHLGFRRITDTVREPIKSAINAAIRRGVLCYQGEFIWRVN